MNPLAQLLGLALLTALPRQMNPDRACGSIPGRSKWVVLKSSNLQITGKTNINQFICGVPQYTQNDTVSFLPAGARGQVRGIPLSGSLRLAIDAFDCKSRMMTGEFKKVLQYGQYPLMRISFINLEKMPDPQSPAEIVKGWVEIGLAGTCRPFEIGYTVSRSGQGSLSLTGTRRLAFHDFGLQPPRKMGGLIRVSDSIAVTFTLCLQQIE